MHDFPTNFAPLAARRHHGGLDLLQKRGLAGETVGNFPKQSICPALRNTTDVSDSQISQQPRNSDIQSGDRLKGTGRSMVLQPVASLPTLGRLPVQPDCDASW